MAIQANALYGFVHTIFTTAIKLHLRVNLVLLTIMLSLFLLSQQSHASLITSLFINEIHYDNTGVDNSEFIELAGTAGQNLLGWQLFLYNGTTNSPYKTVALPDFNLTDQSNGFGFFAIDIASIQNGAADGVALVDVNNQVSQFLSYEGILTADSGPAASLTSLDIGVAESSATPLGFSLQLVGSGRLYQDFSWQSAALSTHGDANSNQKILAAVNVDEPNSLMLLIAAMIMGLMITSSRVNDG